MEQNTMEQLMEFMKTQIGSLERKMNSNQQKMDADKAESLANHLKMETVRKADKEEMMARMEAKMDSNQEKMEAAINSHRSALEGAIKTRVEMQACREVTRLFGGREGTNSRRAKGHGGTRGSPRASDGRGDDRSS
jgi:hypothetical protein